LVGGASAVVSIGVQRGKKRCGEAVGESMGEGQLEKGSTRQGPITLIWSGRSRGRVEV
jgi:hypothetical protein